MFLKGKFVSDFCYFVTEICCLCVFLKESGVFAVRHKEKHRSRKLKLTLENGALFYKATFSKRIVYFFFVLLRDLTVLLRDS